MKDYVAIVAHSNNRVGKFMDFGSLAEAQAHAEAHGGFAAPTPADQCVPDWWIEDEAITLSPVAPSPKAVQRERDRRLSLGFEYDFGDVRGVHRIGTTDADMKGWNEVINLANALIDTGDTTTLIDIVTDTAPCQVTAPEWQAIMLAGALSRQTIWAKSFALQAMDPIPGDYADDKYWT